MNNLHDTIVETVNNGKRNSHLLPTLPSPPRGSSLIQDRFQLWMSHDFHFDPFEELIRSVDDNVETNCSI